MKRRQFISSCASGLGALLFSRKLHAFATETELTFPQQKVMLGKTGIESSLVGLGTGMSGGGRQSNQTRLGRSKFEYLIQVAYDKGVRFFDCADLYGTHSYIVPALKEVSRDKYVINSKIWFHGGGIPEFERPDADVVVKRFLKELGTDYIDIVQIHCIFNDNWQQDFAKQMEILERLKEQGLIRAHGLSVHNFEALKQVADDPWVDVLHARINAYGNYMDASPEEVAPVLKKIHDAGKGIVGMKIIGQGDFRNEPDKIDASIKYVKDLGAVDTMIVGFEKVAEMNDFAKRMA